MPPVRSKSGKAAAKPAGRRKATPADLRRALRDQPLVGLTAAAKILGMKAPNASRLRANGGLPDGIDIEGASQVYIRSEIEELAEKRKAGES